MNEINLKNFKIVTSNDKSDIILSTRKDITDFVALGFYCLYTTIKNPCKTKIKVSYHSISDEYKTECTSIANASFFCIATQVNEVFNYVYDEKVDNMFGVQLVISLSLHTTGVKKLDKLSELLPEKFDIQDSISAQKLAITLIKSKIIM